MTQSLLGIHAPGRIVAALLRRDTWPYTRLFGIGPHWYRQTVDDEDAGIAGPCAYHGARHPGEHPDLWPRCNRPYFQHWQVVGEWMLPRRERWTLIRRRAWVRLTEPRRTR